MKVFVTGGTGYLGAALVDGLLAAGHQITVLTRRPAPLPERPRLTWLHWDLLQGPPEASILGQHRAVLHSAAMVKTWSRDRREFDRVNVEAWDGLLAGCYRAGVPRVLHTSSFISMGPSEDPSPRAEDGRLRRERFLTDYERTKYLADEVTARWAEKGLPVTTLYPGVIFGPGARTAGNLVGKMIHTIARGRFPGTPGSGDQVWNLAYLPDVVDGHLKALERGLPGHGYILGGENIPLEEFVRRVHERLGRAYRKRTLPIGLVETLGSAMESWAVLSGRAPDLTRGVASVYRYHWAFDSSKACKALGYRITPFDTALEATVEWAASFDRWVDA